MVRATKWLWMSETARPPVGPSAKQYSTASTHWPKPSPISCAPFLTL
jgi:hypothetical protein